MQGQLTCGWACPRQTRTAHALVRGAGPTSAGRRLAAAGGAAPLSATPSQASAGMEPGPGLPLPVPHELHGRLAYSHGGGASAVLGERPGRRPGRRTQNRRVGAQLFGSIAATQRVGPDDELGAVLPDTRGRPRPSTPPSLALLFAADVHKCSTTQETALKGKRASKHNFH